MLLKMFAMIYKCVKLIFYKILPFKLMGLQVYCRVVVTLSFAKMLVEA